MVQNMLQNIVVTVPQPQGAEMYNYNLNSTYWLL